MNNNGDAMNKKIFLGTSKKYFFLVKYIFQERNEETT